MKLTKRSILAGSVLLTLVIMVGLDLGLFRPGARRDAWPGPKTEAVASVNLGVGSCV